MTPSSSNPKHVVYTVKFTETAQETILKELDYMFEEVEDWVERLGRDPGEGAEPISKLPNRYRVELHGWLFTYRVNKVEHSVLIHRVRRHPDRVGSE